jgi:hypothetical protein
MVFEAQGVLVRPGAVRHTYLWDDAPKAGVPSLIDAGGLAIGRLFHRFLQGGGEAVLVLALCS